MSVRLPRRALALGALLMVAAMALANAVVACGTPYSSATGTDDGDASNGPSSDATSDAAVVQGQPDPCAHTGVPAAPAAASDAGDDLPNFFMALRTMSLGADGGGSIGFDLDGVCTCDSRAGAAHAGSASCGAAGSPKACDSDGGVDDAVHDVANAVAPLISLDKIPLKLIASGQQTMLIEVGRYNGQLDDPEVAFGLSISAGLKQPACDASVEDVTDQVYSPCWDGNDQWSFLSSTVVPTTKEANVQGLGYVANGVLVLRIPTDVLLPFNASFQLPLGGAVISGTLVPLGEDLLPRDRSRAPTDLEKRLWAVEQGTVGGRIKDNDLLAALGTVQLSSDGGVGSYLCSGSLFSLVHSGICGAQDIASTPTHDFQSTACDALSIGVAFTAFPTLTGAVIDGADTGNPCVPGSNGEPLEAGVSYFCAK